MSTKFFALLVAAAIAGRAAAQSPAPAASDGTASSSTAQSDADASAPDVAAESPPADEEDDLVLPVRLLDRPAFDRVTLNAANGGAIIETVLLDLPDREVPDPLPQTGSLELYQLSQPSFPYAVSWADVAKIELYEQMLLAEAKRLTATEEFAEAFDFYAYLQTNYPKLPGLDDALDSHLWGDASKSFSGGDGEGAWPALLALYERNPSYPRLVNAVQAVSDSLISGHIKAHDFAAAGATLDLVERYFPKLELTNVARWRQQLAGVVEEKLKAARAAIAARNYDAARVAALAAQAIEPDLADARNLLEEIQAAAPEFRVGIMQAGRAADDRGVPDWAAARVAELVNPSLVRMIDFGAEGGVYASRFGDLTTSDSGLETRLRLSEYAERQGITADVVALRLLNMANRDNAALREDLDAALDRVQVADGREVRLQWWQPHLHSEVLLQTPLRTLTDAARSPGLWFTGKPADDGRQAMHFERTGAANADRGTPRVVVERQFDDKAALAALARGEVDALDRVPPWQLEQARDMPGVAVRAYALPTVHVLVPNFANPLMGSREFRRALCYAIDSESIVRDILLGGDEAAGFVPLSGPFPIGVTRNDPAGYGYNADLAPRPYEPRLASLLAGVARATLAKRDLDERKARGETIEAPDPTKEPVQPPPTPLVLMHSSDAVARVACQSIKLQLDRVGIPIDLVEASGQPGDGQVHYDLLYAELAVWEPLTDARRLLGPAGVAGRSSALMTAALDNLDRSQNWNEARARLRSIHRIAYYDLPVIPLWQTVNHFAHRTWLTGVGDHPLTLYLNLDDWRKEFGSNAAGGGP